MERAAFVLRSVVLALSGYPIQEPLTMETLFPAAFRTESVLEMTDDRPLSVAVMYTQGQALDGEAHDDVLLVTALQDAGMDATSVDLTHLAVSPSGSFTFKDPTNGISDIWHLPDAVLMYHGALAPDNTGELLDAMAAAGCEVVNGHSAWQIMTDKWRFFELMDAAGVPTIPTRLVLNHNDAMSAVSQFGWPVVFKTPVGTEGDDVYVVTNESQLRTNVTSRIDELGGRVIAQPFVESRMGEDLEPAILERIGRESIGMRNDFRVMTVHMHNSPPQIIAAFHRISRDAKHVINNVAKGAREVNIEFTDLHPQDQETIWRALNAMPDAQIVGWDLIGRPGERVIMEANSGPALPLMPDDHAAELVLGPCVELVRSSAERARARLCAAR